jgi:hypothetical protein
LARPFVEEAVGEGQALAEGPGVVRIDVDDFVSVDGRSGAAFVGSGGESPPEEDADSQHAEQCPTQPGGPARPGISLPALGGADWLCFAFAHGWLRWGQSAGVGAPDDSRRFGASRIRKTYGGRNAGGRGAGGGGACQLLRALVGGRKGQ